MSDLVVNVRQISSYPELTAAAGGENILVQLGGLGGPYQAISSSVLVATALQSGSMGVGYTVPASAVPGQIFTGSVVLPATGEVFFNCYNAGGGVLNAWTSGPVGIFSPVGAQGGFLWQVATGQAGQPITGGTGLMELNLAGALSLGHGTLTVARDPSAALEVATMGYVGNHTVASFNGRIGVVNLTSSDVYQALCLDSAIATQNWVCDQLKTAFAAMLEGTVVRWNGRAGNVFLMLSDITCVFMQPGQIPITQTPPATSDDYSIANTAWVQQFVADTLAGGGSGLQLATEAWVKANTVASFNGRIGPVTLALSDITAAGGAPTQSPQLLGVPTAPTQAVGNASAAIATTAFVWNAVQESTTGVVSWNGRTGVVTLEATDINSAGGALINSPALTGVPTAPTAGTGTTTTQIATCAFVLNEVQAIGAGVTSFNTRSGNVVLELTDIESAGGAPIASPAFSGNPTAPTPASPVAATTSIANTNWVVQYNALNTVASFNTRIGAVTLNANDITAAGGLANPNVALTGAPTAPTLVPGTSSTGIATTAFVQQAIQNIGGVTVSPTPPATPFTGQPWFNSTAGVQQLNIWTGSAWTPSTNLSAYAALAGATFTGPVLLAGNAAAALQAVPLQQLQTYLPLAGGTITGGLNVFGAPLTLPLQSGAGAGNLTWNLSNNGANWIYNGNGPGAVINLSASSLGFFVAPAGTSGGVATPATVLALTPGTATVTGSLLASGGNITASGQLVANGTGRVLSINTGNNPSFTCYDNSAGNNYATGICTSTGLTMYFCHMDSAGNFVGTLGLFNSAGSLTIAGTLTQNSDATKKTNITPITQGISIVKQLLPKAFAWLTSPDQTQWGFIAQDVEPVIPQAITHAPTDPAGNPGAIGLDITAILAALVNAVKQLDLRCQALEAAASITPPPAELA